MGTGDYKIQNGGQLNIYSKSERHFHGTYVVMRLLMFICTDIKILFIHVIFKNVGSRKSQRDCEEEGGEY